MIERKQARLHGERLVFQPGAPLASWVDGMPRRSDGTWSRIAHEAGYADHSHMVRNFTELLGESPARFAARLRKTA